MKEIKVMWSKTWLPEFNFLVLLTKSVWCRIARHRTFPTMWPVFLLYPLMYGVVTSDTVYILVGLSQWHVHGFMTLWHLHYMTSNINIAWPEWTGFSGLHWLGIRLYQRVPASQHLGSGFFLCVESRLSCDMLKAFIIVKHSCNRTVCHKGVVIV